MYFADITLTANVFIFFTPPSKRQFSQYLDALLNTILSLDVGDHEILWEKVQFSLDERHFTTSSSIQWEKRGICQFPISSFQFLNCCSNLCALESTYLH